jgi:hypothetical protein
MGAAAEQLAPPSQPESSAYGLMYGTTVGTESACDACQRPALTRHVTFRQNIGALVVRFPKTVQGNLCEACIQSVFISTTLTTLVLGWWGLISMIVTPFILVGNVLERMRSR